MTVRRFWAREIRRSARLFTGVVPRVAPRFPDTDLVALQL